MIEGCDAMSIVGVAIGALIFAADVPLPRFELTAVTVNERPDIENGFFSETADLSDVIVPDSYVQHVLAFMDSSVEVKLGKEVTENTRDVPTPVGMDPRSLEVVWVLPGRLLQLRWSTHGIANGHWTVEALVVLERTPNGWRELFRDYHGRSYSGGWNSKSNTSVTLTASGTRGELTLVATHQSFEASTTRAPLTRVVNEAEGKTWYGFDRTEITE